MVVTGTVQKQNLYQAICDAIVSQGSNWTQISSNTTEDYVTGGSDGKIFKSPPIGSNNQSVIFRMKQAYNDWGTQTGNCRLSLWVNIMKNYTPGAAGSNGTMTGTSITNTYTNIYSFNIIDPTEMFKYYVLIENHRLIIMYWKDGFDYNGITAKAILYVGYPELTSNFEIPGVTNNIFIIGNGMLNGGYAYYMDIMLENNLPTKYIYSAGAQTNYWGSTNSYDATTNSFTLYPLPIEKIGAQPGIIFQGYMDGAYLLPQVGSTQIQDLDIISDGVTNYLVLGISIGLYYVGSYIAIRLT